MKNLNDFVKLWMSEIPLEQWRNHTLNVLMCEKVKRTAVTKHFQSLSNSKTSQVNTILIHLGANYRFYSMWTMGLWLHNIFIIFYQKAKMKMMVFECVCMSFCVFVCSDCKIFHEPPNAFHQRLTWFKIASTAYRH